EVLAVDADARRVAGHEVRARLQ
ncbi:MAG: hypothetical protein RL490_1604, partial [Pseudomonadota bacterium]